MSIELHNRVQDVEALTMSHEERLVQIEHFINSILAQAEKESKKVIDSAMQTLTRKGKKNEN